MEFIEAGNYLKVDNLSYAFNVSSYFLEVVVKYNVIILIKNAC